ncbi:MAG: FAD-dependent oxidoreductase [Planctomycetota bacterium]
MTGERQVVVVGGGVVGAACSYYLSRDGWKVTIVDQGVFGKQCSHGNCGYVSPSHVLPLAKPGAIRNALSSMLKPDSPFYIKPRFNLRLWSWLLRFARRCNNRDMLESGHGIAAMLNSARILYDDLMRDEPMVCEWKTDGLIFVLQSAKAMEHFAHTDRVLTETFNMGAERFDGAALNDLEPALKPGLAGGFLYRIDAHLRPDRLMASWRRILQDRGVTLRENCKVTGFAVGNGKAVGIATDQGNLQADAFVVATGSWTPLLEGQLGCRIPIQPGKGYSITMPRPSICPKYPMIFEEHRVAITPMETGYRIGSTMEFAGYDSTLNRRRLDALKKGATTYLREPYCDPVQEEWFGWRPMTPDSRPIVDRSPTMSNVFIAAGHNMLGLSMSPATGKLIAELVGGKTPHLSTEPYSVKRF